MDSGMGRAASPKKVIGIRTSDIHIRVPGGFCLPMSNTRFTDEVARRCIKLFGQRKVCELPCNGR